LSSEKKEKSGRVPDFSNHDAEPSIIKRRVHKNWAIGIREWWNNGMMVSHLFFAF
jgi:hypothetical protein